jgi:carboxymethylenebutenolidase
MCFDSDSEPPIPHIAGAAVSYDDLTLTSADGTELAAFLATPDAPATSGVVILPDVRGLYHFYEELALRFAERGHAAVAFDFYGRTAGAEKRGEGFDYPPHREQTTREGIQADVAACVEYLREHGAATVFTVGFCFGGLHSWLATAAGHGIAGAVGFYGRPPLDDVPRMEAPILALQGGADAAISVEDDEAFDVALTAAGIDHEVIVYDGAPHSFFDRKQEEFQADSDDAWRRTLEFIERHS